MRFGIHCSLKNGLAGALFEARDLNCEAMQIFVRSPRMWKPGRQNEPDIEAFKALRKQYGIFPLAVHLSYLPNIATSDPVLYKRSEEALTQDLSVSESIGADFLVLHPGSYSEGSTAKEGVKLASAAVNRALEAVSGKCLVLIESVSGGGHKLGSAFEEIAGILNGIKEKARAGVCLDTAHTFAAGFDLSKPEGTDSMLSEFDRTIGLVNLKMAHFNDSLVPMGSKKDRHQHLGKGYIGTKGLKYLVEKLDGLAEAGILETPKDPEGADKLNIELLYKWRGK